MPKHHNAREEWLATVRLVSSMLDGAPPELQAFFVKVTNDTCDIAEELQVAPAVTAAAASAMIGALAMAHVNGNVHADEEIDAFLYLCRAAMHAAVAKMRIAQGWTPNRQ